MVVLKDCHQRLPKVIVINVRWCFCGAVVVFSVVVFLWRCGGVFCGGDFVVVWWCVLKDSHQRLPKVLLN